MLESFSGWLTPTSLFLLLNIVIGTIWVTSLFGTHHKNHHQQQPEQYYSSPPLARAPSLIDRVKSINFGLYKYDPHHSDESYYPPADQVYANIKAQQASPPPSLLHRVKSVNFSDFQFSFFRSDFHHQSDHEHDLLTVRNPVHHSEPDLRNRALARVPSLLDRVKSINLTDVHQFSLLRSEPEHEPLTVPNPVHHSAPAGPDLRNRAIARAPSLLERVKSINLTDLHQFSLFRSEISGSVPDPVLDGDNRARRSRSENRKGAASEKMKKPASEKMKKSASEKMNLGKEAEEEVERRRPETARVERTVSIGGDVEVDARADDFINKFKHQLKLQRLDSILQYKDMITRGASK